MDWIELSAEVDPEAVESVSELFARTGYNGGVVVEQALVPRVEEANSWDELISPAQIDPTRPVSVRTYIPDDADAPTKMEEIRKALWALGMMRQVGELRTRPCKEEDWANAWKAYYGVQRMGERTVIKPSWLEYTPQEGDIVLDLDPGMAFGTGLHPTTRLCLAALEHHAAPDLNALDLGTGSGILAIAAAKIGGPTMEVLALDTDPIAVEASIANVERNGLSGQIAVELGSTGAAESRAPYDLIVANILATVIIDLAHSLAGLLKEGGTLISSGIFVDKGERVAEALERAGLPVRERNQEGDWLCLVSERRG
jgi:ribosomal protein L11 methyltransferase